MSPSGVPPRLRYRVTFIAPNGAKTVYAVATRAGKIKAAAVAGAAHAGRTAGAPLGTITVRSLPRVRTPGSYNYWLDEQIRSDDLRDPAED